jgi:Cu-processing system ATP-binding protein
MPQIARFPENMTVFELFAIVRDLRRHAQQPCAVDDDLVSRFGLGAMMHSPLRVLSGGSKQKVNAALAFLFSPSLLIMDEPTAGLDPVASSVLKDKILQVRSEQRTVLITSHVMRELQELADDVAVLVDGVVHFAGPVDDLLFRTRQPTLERAVAEVLSRPAAA